MMVVINNTPGTISGKIRSIFCRYLWRISRDVWVWPKASIRYDILHEIASYEKKVNVIFIWSENKTYLHFNYKIFGKLQEKQNELGLFNHKLKLVNNKIK